MYAVEMQDLTKQYGSKTVVDGLALMVRGRQQRLRCCPV